ncbi:hypothetical protein GGR52DRAFT_555082 [Hypoxylon sp. FL1284]|nr:hypothetical protein GGR52DRAFT_555082 [Hypoxylon sp. FL1284]
MFTLNLSISHGLSTMSLQGMISCVKGIGKRRSQAEQEEGLRDDQGDHDPAASSTHDGPLPPAEDSSQTPEVGTSPRPARGLRKATVSSNGQLARPDRRRPIHHVEPSDYLYFGEGVSAADVSRSLLSKSPRISDDNSSLGPRAAAPSSTTSSGRDGSGFLKNESSTHTAQMGYSYLTYGGSLQYDYAGTQT